MSHARACTTVNGTGTGSDHHQLDLSTDRHLQLQSLDMVQDWLLLDLDARTKYKMGQLGDKFFHIGRDVFRMLWVPPPVPPFELKLRQDLGIDMQIRDDRCALLSF